MNRDALLVYLRDLRDLELAKLSLPTAPARGAAALLQDAYALNLIPTSYRNLTFVYYLYDTMSTSLATMEDALRPERLTQGTKQALERLYQDTTQHPPALLCARHQEACLPERDRRTEQLLAKLEETSPSEKERTLYIQIQVLHQETSRFFARLA